MCEERRQMTAMKRKFPKAALVSAITVAALAGCSTGGGTKVAQGAVDKEAGAAAKQAVAPSSGAPSADPFAGLGAEEIARESVTATKGAKSLRLTAQGTDGGHRVKVDFSLDERGTCAGAAPRRQRGRVHRGGRRHLPQGRRRVLAVDQLRRERRERRERRTGPAPEGQVAQDPRRGTPPGARWAARAIWTRCSTAWTPPRPRA